MSNSLMYYNPYTHCHELVANFGGAYRLYVLSDAKWLFLPLGSFDWLVMPLSYVSLQVALSTGFEFKLPFLIINEETQKLVFRCAAYH